MNSWREYILKEFIPGVARLTLVSDPDGLMAEEGIIAALRERGFELLEFEDPIAFRYSYESKYRSKWDRGELTELVVAVRVPTNDLTTLPYDLLQAGRILSFNLGEIFPNLSYPVVESLDRSDLDALYRAQIQYKPDNLGDNATKDFVLRHVFGIAPELINQPSDLLRVLLRRHYKGQRIPSIIDERFIQIIRQNKRFNDWPLEQIIPDREAFFSFLQERWPIFLDKMVAGEVDKLSELQEPYLRFSGPKDIPFDHDDIRVYIDNLFLEGILRPVQHPNAERLSDKWVSVGLMIDPARDAQRRMERLLKSIETTIPSIHSRYHDWLSFAPRWTELITLFYEIGPSDNLKERFLFLQERIDGDFQSWVKKRYTGLHNQPPIPPVMLHHVPKVMARNLEHTDKGKVALVLIDGMAFDQWIILRNKVAQQLPELQVRERAVFAWIPTITPVSRQSIFAGKPPIYFPESIHTTNREMEHWSSFWIDQGLSKVEVGYVKGIRDGKLELVEEIISHPKIRVVGIIVDKIDKIMHGMELGTAGMYNQVRQWLEQGFMIDLLNLLIEHEFSVFLTSDHGNIEAKGCGCPSEGSVADLRGERVRIYSDVLLRRQTKERFPDAIDWPNIGLPDNYLPLLAAGRSAFVSEGETVVVHGGITVEELIVPFVQFERRTG